MELLTCKTHDEVVERAHLWCESRVKMWRAQSIFLPAGNTPTALFKYWEKTKPGFLTGKRLLQVDDVITGRHQGMFRRYFEDNLPSYKHQLQRLDSASEVADLAILGFGVNGHVAFHEPGIPKDFFSGCLPLSEESKKTLSLEPNAWGLTYGLGAFLKTKAVLLIITGEKKRPMFERFLKETDTFPAACLKSHADLTVLVDF